MGRGFYQLSGSWWIHLAVLLVGMICAAPRAGAIACDCGGHAEIGSGQDAIFCIDYYNASPFPCNTSNPYHPETTSASSVSSAVASSVTTSIDSMTTAVTTAKGQAGTVKAAGNVALTGANTKANGALLFCAEGANRELDATGSGVEDIATCQGDFKAADQMAAMAAKNGNEATLTRDEGMLSNAAALAALEKFEKNFGVSKDEYVNRMLASHGKGTEFASMLSSKFSEEKLDKMFASAEAAQPASEEASAVAQSPETSGASGISKAKINTGLRDSLKAKLEAAEASRKLASAKTPQTDYHSIKAPGEKLQPAGLEGLINSSDGQPEESLTIFDVIHQKLQSLHQREQI